MEERIDKLEIVVTEQMRVIEDLHQMVRLQDTEIARLKSHVRLLLERAAEAESGAGAVLADQKPPHY